MVLHFFFSLSASNWRTCIYNKLLNKCQYYIFKVSFSLRLQITPAYGIGALLRCSTEL